MHAIGISPGKGLGVFATQDIPRGARIIADEPLFKLEIPTAINIYRAFLALSAASQHEYLSLTYCTQSPTDDVSSNETITDGISMIPHPLKPHDSPEIQIYAEELAENNVGADRILNINLIEGARVVAIFHNNAFDMRAAQGTIHFGIFMQLTRINHSCLPNVCHSWNENLGKRTVHANRDIKEGEEITLSYVRPLQSREDRMRQLEGWGIDCDCPACDVGTDFGIASAERRKRLQELEDLMMQSVEKGPVQSEDENVCSEMIDLLEQEGLDGWEKGQAHVNLSDIYRENGDLGAAFDELSAGLEIAMRCFGSEEAMTRQLQDDLSRLKAYVHHDEHKSVEDHPTSPRRKGRASS